MAIPDYETLMLPLLSFVSDGLEHSMPSKFIFRKALGLGSLTCPVSINSGLPIDLVAEKAPRESFDRLPLERQ